MKYRIPLYFIVFIVSLTTVACTSTDKTKTIITVTIKEPTTREEVSLTTPVPSQTPSIFEPIPTATARVDFQLSSSKDDDAEYIESRQPTPTLSIYQPLDSLLLNVQLVGVHDLRNLDTFEGPGKVIFRTGDGVEINSDDSLWSEIEKYFATEILNGEGIILSLSFNPGTRMKIYLQTTSGNGNFRWGVVQDNVINSYTQSEGTTKDGPVLPGRYVLVPNQEFRMMIALDGKDTLGIVIWNNENPELRREFRENYSDLFPGQTWSLKVRVKEGLCTITELSRFKFDEYR